MRIHSVQIWNYRPFAHLEEVKLGPLATIVGRNDAGKSSILRALSVFFDEKAKLEETDVYAGADRTSPVVIDVALTDLPSTIELEEGVATSLQEELLLDEDGFLRIGKVFEQERLGTYSVGLTAEDYTDDVYSGLPLLKEQELNRRCEDLGIPAPKSGRGITNKSKRDAIRAKAADTGVPTGPRALSIPVRHELWKRIAALLPEFHLFEAEQRTGVGETSFQSEFRPIIRAAAAHAAVEEARRGFTEAIGEALQAEVDSIYSRLRQHTDAISQLTAKPEFTWDKAVAFDIWGTDPQGIESSVGQRGSGIRRLLMVAFFQYLAEKAREGAKNLIFAVEEPENCLHPGLQRQLVGSFMRLADTGFQIIVTSHSPVFAGWSPLDDLALVIRRAGQATASQGDDLDISDVAEELGVEPCDQITGYHACVFVEGHTDAEFLSVVARRLKDGGHIDADFGDRRIGFAFVGGESLRHWITRRAMVRLTRRFAVVVDSDRRDQADGVPGRKLNWKRACEDDGGLFFITEKREIENYLHPRALQRHGLPHTPFDDYTDMKATFGPNVYKAVDRMTCEEILERDMVVRDGRECHELKEMIQRIIDLVRVPGEPA